ncbi:MAG: ParB/RepB/Spo0J family partition protein [Blastocatellia bacterium]
MNENNNMELNVASIDPSPYQPRQNFDPVAVDSLAQNIKENSLIHPIICRPKGERFELVVGERRWRAVRKLGWLTITANVREMSDSQAQIICLSENLQREDLTDIETIESIGRWVDAHMQQDPEYLPWLEVTLEERRGGPTISLDLGEPIDRTIFFLALCDSDRKNETERVSNKFVANLESAFLKLNRRLDWQSYFAHDLPIIRAIPEAVRATAIEQRLNKSQTLALRDAYEQQPEAMARILETGVVESQDDQWQHKATSLRDMPAKEIKALVRKPTAATGPVEQGLPRISMQEIKQQISQARAVLKERLLEGVRLHMRSGKSLTDFASSNAFDIYEFLLPESARAEVIEQLSELHVGLETYARSFNLNDEEIKKLSKHKSSFHVPTRTCLGCFGDCVAAVLVNRIDGGMGI